MAKAKVVLAYSGGLDTSCCIQWLKETHDLDVITLVCDLGQEAEDLDVIKAKALKIGAIESLVADVREEFVNEFLSKAIAANAMYENKYPLLSALSRPVIAKKLVQVAHQYGAEYVAHGCTGKGNDQVRFEVGVHALDPDIKVLAPVREWELHTRPEEIAFAESHGIPVDATRKSPYSIDDNLWGRAIECGVLEDAWQEPPADVYKMTNGIGETPSEPQYVTISFENGLPSAIEGKPMSFLSIIEELNLIAGTHGVGRIDIIENRLVGLKSREIYEVPAATVLIEAHKAIEDMCLDAALLHQKLEMEHKWAELVYNGLWYSQLKEALDAFNAVSQKGLSGQIKMRFHAGSCVVVGRKSTNALYSQSLATYGDGDTFDRDSAKGFIDLWGLSTKTWAQIHKDEVTKKVDAPDTSPVTKTTHVTVMDTAAKASDDDTKEYACAL